MRRQWKHVCRTGRPSLKPLPAPLAPGPRSMSVVSPTRLRRCYSTAFFEFLRDEHGNGDCLELRNEARAGSGPSDVAPDAAVDFACPDRALQG